MAGLFMRVPALLDMWVFTQKALPGAHHQQ